MIEKLRDDRTFQHSNERKVVWKFRLDPHEMDRR
jgi:hypothetical protein